MQLQCRREGADNRTRLTEISSEPCLPVGANNLSGRSPLSRSKSVIICFQRKAIGFKLPWLATNGCWYSKMAVLAAVGQALYRPQPHRNIISHSYLIR